MAVERLTDYTRRIWTGLAADAPDPDMQVGDVIYYMDTSTCSIITGIPAPGSIDTEELPDVGGGGGGGGGDIQSGSFVLATASRRFTVPLDGAINNFLFYIDSFPLYPDGQTGWLTLGGMWRSATAFFTLKRYPAGQSGDSFENTATATSTEISCEVVNYNIPAGVNVYWLGW